MPICSLRGSAAQSNCGGVGCEKAFCPIEPQSGLIHQSHTAGCHHKRAMMEVAVVTTVWSKNSHADVIAGKFLRGFPTDDGVM